MFVRCDAFGAYPISNQNSISLTGMTKFCLKHEPTMQSSRLYSNSALDIFFLFPKGIPHACQVGLILRCSEVTYRGRQLACEFAPFAKARDRTPNHLLKGREYLSLTSTRQVSALDNSTAHFI